MIKEGDIVVIKEPITYNKTKIIKLNRKKGVVDRILYSDKRPFAVWVAFKRNKKTYKYLFALKSVETISVIDKLRTLNILKHTFL